MIEDANRIALPVTRSLRAAAPALLVAVVTMLPFFGKAYTIDDTLFMLQAQHALVDPLHPTAFRVVWGYADVPLSIAMPSGPVMAWLLLPAAALDGAEWAAHGMQLALLLLGVWATAALALRLTDRDGIARWAALLVASSAAVIGMATTVMPDVAAMSLLALACLLLVRWYDAGRARDGIAAAVCLAAAILARSHVLLCVAPALGLGLTRQRPWLRWRATWPVALALVIAAAVLRLTIDPEAVGETARWALKWDRPEQNAVAYGAHWVWTVGLGGAWAIWRARTLVRRQLAWGIAAIVVLGLVALGLRGLRLLAAAVAIAGVAAQLDALGEGWRRRDLRWMSLAAVPFCALPMIAYLHLPPKYLLPAVPGAAILLARWVCETGSRRAAQALLTATLCYGLILGFAIASADATFADYGRHMARALIPPLVKQGRRVFINGHWGFQWYAMQAGGKHVSRTPFATRRGDMLVYDERTGIDFLNDPYRKRRLVAQYSNLEPGGRVMSQAAGAGFFSPQLGPLPWGWSREPLNTYRVWEIQ